MEGVSGVEGRKEKREDQTPLNIKTMAETRSRGVSLLRQQTVWDPDSQRLMGGAQPLQALSRPIDKMPFVYTHTHA